MEIKPRVVDTSHYDEVEPDGFQKAKAWGIWGVINKASEGTSSTDKSYAERRKPATDAGLYYGAYHFVRAGLIEQQVEKFLSVAKPDDKTLLALDWEINSVTVDMAEEFLQGVIRKVGRKAWIYSGNTAKELLGSRPDAFFGSHRLWLAQYGSRPICQRSWSEPDLWQYTGDGLGPSPHTVPGIHIDGGLDINHYGGTQEQLGIDWVTDRGAVTGSVKTTDPDHSIVWLQTSLNKLGASPQLNVDGDMGPKTERAIKSFQRLAGVNADGIVGPVTLAALEFKLAVLQGGQ